MRPISLPYRKVINWFSLYFFGIPLMVFLWEYFTGEKTTKNLNGILFNILPALMAIVGFTPLFKFKSDNKETAKNTFLKIPVLELYALLVVGLFSFVTFAGLLFIFEGEYRTGGFILIVSAPIPIVLLLAVNSKRIWFKEQLIPEIVKKELEKKRSNIGMFKYTDTGFIYHGENKIVTCDWTEVQGIIAYKTDNFVYDTIHLALKINNGEEFDLHEDIAGWYIFKNKLPDNLIGIDKFWELKVMSPPFDENVTLVYQKGKDLMKN